MKITLSKKSMLITPEGSGGETSMLFQMPRATWQSSLRCFRAPLDGMNARYLLASGFAIPEDVRPVIEKAAAIQTPGYEPIPEFETKWPPYAHQSQILEKAHNLDCALLAMDMGTGKTKTVLDLLALNKDKHRQVLIVCPLSVRENWLMQLEDHSVVKDRYAFLLGFDTKSQKEMSVYALTTDKNPYLIVGSESLASSKKTQEYITKYVKNKPTALICDESHLFKTYNSARTEFLTTVAEKCPLRYFLSGTSITNNYGDLFPILTMMSPDILGTDNYFAFRAKYLVLNEFKVGAHNVKQVIGHKNEIELWALISRYVFTCKKDDVLDLPPKTYHKRFLEVPPVMKTALSLVKKRLIEKSLTPIISQLAVVREGMNVLAGYVKNENDEKSPVMPYESTPKMREILSILESTDSQCVIWSPSVYEIENITLILNKKDISAASFYGDTAKDTRGDIVASFQKGDVRVLVANPSVGGAGIELVAADLVIYVSNSFKYADRAQSEDRCHRIGQTKSVAYIDLIYKNSYDELVMDALAAKKDLSAFLDNINIEDKYSGA